MKCKTVFGKTFIKQKQKKGIHTAMKCKLVFEKYSLKNKNQDEGLAFVLLGVEMEDDFVLTWRRVKACPLTRRLSTAHFMAYWLALSLSIATATDSSLLSPLLFAILLPTDLHSIEPFQHEKQSPDNITTTYTCSNSNGLGKKNVARRKCFTSWGYIDNGKIN